MLHKALHKIKIKLYQNKIVITLEYKSLWSTNKIVINDDIYTYIQLSPNECNK